MQSAEYWSRRAEEVIRAGEKTALEMLTDSKRTFEAAMASIEKEVEAFFGRYSTETGLPIEEVRRRLIPEQLGRAHEDIKRYYAEYRRLGGDPAHREYLRELSARAYISRREELKLQMSQTLERLYRDNNALFADGLKKTYNEAYYRTAFNIQQGTGLFQPFAALNNQILETVIRTRWLEQNYSDRLWAHKDALLNQLETTFMQGVALGHNPRRIGRDMARNMNTAVNNTVRLARTEFNHAANSATLKAMKEHHIEQYKFDATLDSRTSEICQSLDGKVFDLSVAEEGVNYPPMHPNCRSRPNVHTQNLPGAVRAARDPVTGRIYYVPAEWTYQDWLDSLTDEQMTHYMAKRKADAVRSSDRAQFDRYKQYIRDGKKEHGAALMGELFEGFPTRFDDFQEMKYLRPDEWEVFRENRAKIS